MSNLDKYVEEKTKELKDKNIKDELEIIRYIYIDLGKNLSFDNNFIPFGNRETRAYIYNHSKDINDLNRCMNINHAICLSFSYIIENVLRNFGISIYTIVEQCKDVRYNHAYNFIKLKDGRKFCIDLQEDICNIQTHSFTSSFGLESPFSNKRIISRQEQEQIDKKIGYIKDKQSYSNDYLYLLHSVADGIEDFREKAQFILENIDCTDTSNMGYIDRQWHHERVLEEFFDLNEFDYMHNTGNITIHNCYKDINGKRKYICFILVRDETDVDIYVYNKKRNGYRKMNMENYMHCLENGLMIKVKERVH